ncbi:MAG TPA: hypothetical protein VE130_03765 [Nitrososphaeraceae archaeon]|jgi:hypothetical protein|nr:hypothetical protein [Nitrososphaeraceae archaeon]
MLSIKKGFTKKDNLYRRLNAVNLKSVVTGLMLFILLIVSAYSSSSLYQLPSLVYASTSPAINTIPTAEVVHTSESMKIPPSVQTFVILIPNEAHENWSDEKHKLITDKNAYYVPTNLIIPKGTGILFLDADAPWDTPHPHTIELQDSTGNVVYSTGQLDYTNSSRPTVPESPGTYDIVDKSYDTKEAKITVLDNETSNDGDLIVGGFYTPTNQVENTEDNDGVSHPGSLQYYRDAFSREGFDILSEYNFTYATCDYCPGEYWPDNKSGEHTLFIYSTQQPLMDALEKLGKLVKDNVYI